MLTKIDDDALHRYIQNPTQLLYDLTTSHPQHQKREFGASYRDLRLNSLHHAQIHALDMLNLVAHAGGFFEFEVFGVLHHLLL